jgi:hypothetical protein
MFSRFASRWNVIDAVLTSFGAHALQKGQSAESVVMFPGSQACRTKRGPIVSLTASYTRDVSRVAHPPNSRRSRHDNCHRCLCS